MAAMTLVYEDAVLRIYWHEVHEYYLSEWLPVFRKGADLKRAYQACIDAARARPGAPWLADASKFAVIDPADVKWIETWFWPEFIRAGAAYEAAVAPEKTVSKMSASRSVEKMLQKGGFEITVHATRADAERALLEWQEKQRAE
ncbi:MAG TPA: hypothetical protein VMR31_01910 [Myxococcota bacterium]|nr:hypothetical protein [Myxococcota bacterium]